MFLCLFVTLSGFTFRSTGSKSSTRTPGPRRVAEEGTLLAHLSRGEFSDVVVCRGQIE